MQQTHVCIVNGEHNGEPQTQSTLTSSSGLVVDMRIHSFLKYPLDRPLWHARDYFVYATVPPPFNSIRL